jgi:hypothetical protein
LKYGLKKKHAIREDHFISLFAGIAMLIATSIFGRQYHPLAHSVARRKIISYIPDATTFIYSIQSLNNLKLFEYFFKVT